MSDLSSGTSRRVPQEPARLRPRYVLLEGTLLTFYKPRLRKAVRPLAARLAHAGVTANQVTVASLVGSILVGTLLCLQSTHAWLFALLPVWMITRTMCAAVDGTLAVEFGQKSRLGGILNEAGDVVADVALLLPFAFATPSTLTWIILAIVLAVLCELIGMAGPVWGRSRRLDGPLGKLDRSIVLSFFAMSIATLGSRPELASIFMPLLCAGLAITAWNRLRLTVLEPVAP